VISALQSPQSLLRESIPSCLKDAESLCLKVRRFVKEAGLPELCFPVELLARECLTNGVIHGNGNCADKSISLSLSIGRKWIRLEVSDEGAGFRRPRHGQQSLDTTRSSGRGLQLCSLYAERVQFNRRGNRITLWIRKGLPIGKDIYKMAAYVLKQEGQQGLVTLKGDLTAIVVPDLQADLKQMLSNGARELVFDLSNSGMLDSSGMGLLIAAANSLAPQGGKIRVTNVGADIFRLLQSMRLTARLNVSATA